MAKLACQQHYHGLNYTKLPLRRGKMRGRGRWREVTREVGKSEEDRQEGERGRGECEMGDSKVTVWERDGEEEVVLERQMVTC